MTAHAYWRQQRTITIYARSAKYIKMADCAEKDEETKDSKDMEDLASLLGVPQDTIQALASSDDYRVVLEKVVDHFNSNSLELEEYTATIRQFSENLDVSDVQMSTCF